jgi:hypothetical protein
MSDRRIFTLVNAEVRRRAIEAIRQAPDNFVVRLGPMTRTLEQNALQWKILEQFERQLKWPIDGKLRYLSTETWKEVLTAAFKHETAMMAQGIYGGYVMVGMSTSDMGRREFSEWLEFLHAIAAELGVRL